MLPTQPFSDKLRCPCVRGSRPSQSARRTGHTSSLVVTEDQRQRRPPMEALRHTVRIVDCDEPTHSQRTRMSRAPGSNTSENTIHVIFRRALTSHDFNRDPSITYPTPRELETWGSLGTGNLGTGTCERIDIGGWPTLLGGGWAPSPAGSITRIVRCRQRRKMGCAPSRAFREGPSRTADTVRLRFYVAGGRIFIFTASHSFTRTRPASPRK